MGWHKNFLPRREGTHAKLLLFFFQLLAERCSTKTSFQERRVLTCTFCKKGTEQRTSPENKSKEINILTKNGIAQKLPSTKGGYPYQASFFFNSLQKDA